MLMNFPSQVVGTFSPIYPPDVESPLFLIVKPKELDQGISWGTYILAREGPQECPPNLDPRIE
jgi:hypothetical protein